MNQPFSLAMAALIAVLVSGSRRPDGSPSE